MTRGTLSACQEKMRQAGASAWQVRRFERDLERLQSGARWTLAETDLEPVSDLPSVPPAGAHSGLERTLIIKLNGGLGTSMGLTGPKSLIEIRAGQSFLDLTVSQIQALRRRTGAPIPLLLMNSFYTRSASLARLAELGFSNPAGVPLEFVQSKVPKLRQADLFPVEHPADPELEWCPPGHGELYAALAGSGLLDRLLEAGYRYAFVSNIDNLGAILDLGILSWFAASDADFVMEATLRTDQDKKGGHLARRRADGRLVLRESSQCPPSDRAAFEDIERYRYFNTNNLWLDLKAWRRGSEPELPLIVNPKTVDPGRPESTPVFQLESAMGAAISSFPQARAVVVPRTRFLPVKNLADLLLLGSDLFTIDSTGEVRPTRAGPLPSIRLDPRTFGSYSDYARRVLHYPELLSCRSLTVQGDVRFDRPMRLEGDVVLEGPALELDK